MLPSLGLFKSISCPLYPNCQRNPCFYSHTTQRSSTVKDRPIEKVKRQKLNEPRKEIVKKEITKKPLVQKSEPFIPSLMPAVKQNPPSKVISTADAIAKATVKPLNPKTSGTSVTLPKMMSALEARKRVAHTATFATKPTGPPTILPNVKSNIALRVRQLIATKLFESFQRIYQPILQQKPTLATEHAQLQEERILAGTTNEAGYKQMATAILMRLKKRPVATSPTDTGLDGDWLDPTQPKPALAWLAQANACIASLEKLKALNYPLPDLLLSGPVLERQEMAGTVHVCDRCQQDYLVKAILDEDDMKSCRYHPVRVRMMQVDGVKQKVYGCCEDALGSEGCTRGPHVYKDEDSLVLHQKIPYLKAPSREAKVPKKQFLVALDCEMGYTTIGMELIRLTAVNEKSEILLDELVLPSSMIVDLNTHYSGVKTLEGVRYDLNSLRKELFKYIDEDTIIVGHGLENDMNALRIIHTNIIDTVDLFPHKNGLPYRNSLKMLASAHLKKFIQTGSDGHDSLEDARTCIELLELYIKKVLSKKQK